MGKLLGRTGLFIVFTLVGQNLSFSQTLKKTHTEYTKTELASYHEKVIDTHKVDGIWEINFVQENTDNWNLLNMAAALVSDSMGFKSYRKFFVVEVKPVDNGNVKCFSGKIDLSFVFNDGQLHETKMLFTDISLQKYLYFGKIYSINYPGSPRIHDIKVTAPDINKENCPTYPLATTNP